MRVVHRYLDYLQIHRVSVEISARAILGRAAREIFAGGFRRVGEASYRSSAQRDGKVISNADLAVQPSLSWIRNAYSCILPFARHRPKMTASSLMTGDRGSREVQATIQQTYNM
jgi:aryl-alcohol dehydrogenase-like predicted oxidoreductase